jgi:hypothetical protein
MTASKCRKHSDASQPRHSLRAGQRLAPPPSGGATVPLGVGRERGEFLEWTAKRRTVML